MAGPGHRESRAVILALGAALALRLAFGFGYWVDKPLTHDEHEYLELGRNLAAGRGFTYDEPAGPTTERFGRAPLYPLLVASVATIVPLAILPEALKAVQAALGTLTVLLLAAIVMRMSGPRAAGITAWAGALYPPLVWMNAYVLSETFYAALAWLNVLVLGRLIDGSGPDGSSRTQPATTLTLLGSGVLGGLAALTRPAHLFFLLLAGLWLVVRHRTVWAATLALGALLVIAPWTARNYMAYGRFVLIASEGGVTFWTGNHPRSAGEGDMAANPAIKLDNLRLRSEHPGLTPEELEPVYYREALERIAADPVWWLGLEARKGFYFWIPVGRSYTLHSRLYRWATWVSYGLLLPVGAAGLIGLMRAGARPRALLLLLGSAVLVCLVFLPQERFRLPVVDPALLVGAGVLAARAPRLQPA
jgi:hypothetical protein